MDRPSVLVRGAGDLASGIAHRLVRAGFAVAMTEVRAPLSVRRGVCFSEAVFEGEKTVEGVTARLVERPDEITPCWAEGHIAILVDPALDVLEHLPFDAAVDATMAKRKMPGLDRLAAPVVVAIGPGWRAPDDAGFVVETLRGHDLGRVITSGAAAPDTGIPAPVAGYTVERVLRSPCAGILVAALAIADPVAPGDVVARVAGREVRAPIAGVLRGILRSGLTVAASLKIGDIDPRAAREHCFTISDRARAVAGGVLEALLAGGAARLVGRSVPDHTTPRRGGSE